MNGSPIIIRTKPDAWPSKPEDLRPWVIASYGKTERGDLLGLPSERAEVGKPCHLDPCFEVWDDVLLGDPMAKPGYSIQNDGLVSKVVIGARRLLIPPKHWPSAHTADLIPVYLFRFEQLSETDLIVAHKFYSAVTTLVEGIDGAYREAAGGGVVLATSMPPAGKAS